MNSALSHTKSEASHSVTPTKPSIGWLLIFLLGICVIIIASKQPWSPIAAWTNHVLTLEDLSNRMESELQVSVFVPLGALIVVFFRVTLGLRVLGPFRSILLALAFRVTGAIYGVLYLAVAVGLFVGLRPAIKKLKLPYFGRTTLMLCCVSFLMSVGALVAKWTQIPSFGLVVFFPIVVLSLVADAFSRVAAKEGLRSAIWRVITTAALAIGIAWLMNIPGLLPQLLHYPELILAEMAGIIVVCRWMGWRLLDKLNPVVAIDAESGNEEDEEDEEDEIRVRARRAVISSL
jgi:7 transmembrane helices usually fused to an inactive transglutaminase